MSLKFYNTLGNRVQDFKEINKGKVGFYMCGPTVYNFAHIGNFRSNIFQDLVKRYLIYSGYDVYHVMNITDVEDKIIKKAVSDGISINEVTAPFIESFMADRDTLNISPADVYPRATEHIDEMLALVEKLESNGFAYPKGGSVYFDISKFENYGRLANITKDKLKFGVSVDSDEYDKEDVQDFVLWKGKKEGEPSWESKYGPGRPGWHIECSAMSNKYLGETFDIHMGGVDLIFPHHENEIAQSECATGKPFVNYWIHCQHLVVDNKKMSKSLGNQYTLRDLLEKGYDPMTIRYLLLSTHYRKLLNFTFEGLDSAAQSLKRIKDFIFSMENLDPAEGETEAASKLIEDNEKAFREQMDNDFNISGALGVFFDFIHQANLLQSELKKKDRENVLAYVDGINSVLGVIEKEEGGSLEQEILEKIELRVKARKDKDFQLADSIRDELKARGIELIDTPDGTKWKPCGAGAAGERF
ncbi:MAG: cysteine--tRNA ligase, partial [Candidatus Aminicenantes bacterium]|nr:cysteine--tRNA ligase [Candidatus Aminicenantes bacterium]